MSALLGTIAKPATGAVGWPSRGLFVFYGIFLGGVFGYVWLRIKPAVMFHVYGPFLALDRAHFTPHLKTPGGIVEHLGALTSQLDDLSWAGALMFSALTGVICWLTAKVTRESSGRAPEISPIIAALVLLLAREQPGFPALTVGIGLMLALSAAIGWCVWAPERRWLRVASSGGLSVLIFWTAGFWPAVSFALLTVLNEGLRRRNRVSAASCAAAAVAAVLALVYLLGIPFSKLVSPAAQGPYLAYAAALHLCVPLLTGVFCLMPAPTVPEVHPAPHGRHKAEPTARLQKKQFQMLILKRAGQTALVCGGWLGVWLAFDRQQQLLSEMDYYTSRRMDEQVLASARRSRSLDTPAQLRLHLALYHTGRLGEELFAFPLTLGAEPLPGVAAGLNACRPQALTLLEMGLVSDAEHLAHEALEMEGDRPDVLRELAWINVLKERPRAAGIFLNVLGKIPREREAAQASLSELAEDPRMSNNPLLNRVRPLMVTNDLPHEAFPAEALLRHLLLFNPRNRMAFEYLMTHYLLTLELKKAIERLGQVGNFGYAVIPRHYEEAVLLFQALEQTTVQLDGGIRPDTVARFAKFNEAMRQRVYATPEGQEMMLAAFGDTFWHYYYVTQSYLKRSQTEPGGQ